MSEFFTLLFPDVAVSKNVWRWIERSQYELVKGGAHQALSLVDLLICATAVQHDLVVLHDDKDFATAARFLPEIRQRNVFDAPPA